MVEFLQDVKGDGFIYEKGKRYCAVSDLKEEDLTDKIFVRQPNSPKKKNWWSSFPKSLEGDLFKVLSDDDLDYFERAEETRLLQL